MNVVLTGSTGHVGYALLLKLIERGWNVTVLLRRPDDRITALGCTPAIGDVTDRESLCRAFAGADAVFHSAGMVEISKGAEEMTWKVNYQGTLNVIDACRQCGVKKLVYLSSVDAMAPLPGNELMTEADNKFDPDIVEGTYAKTKASATARVLAEQGDGLDVYVVQPSACIGPYDFKVSSAGVFVRMFIKGKMPVTMTFGGYNFVDVRDVAEGACLALEKGAPGQCWFLCGEQISVDGLIRTLCKITGRKYPKIKLSKGFCTAVAPLTEKYYALTKQTPLFTPYSIRKLCANGNYSIEKARTELGYSPMSVEQSMRDMIDWINENEQ